MPSTIVIILYHIISYFAITIIDNIILQYIILGGHYSVQLRCAGPPDQLRTSLWRAAARSTAAC